MIQSQISNEACKGEMRKPCSELFHISIESVTGESSKHFLDLWKAQHVIFILNLLPLLVSNQSNTRSFTRILVLDSAEKPISQLHHTLLTCNICNPNSVRKPFLPEKKLFRLALNATNKFIDDYGRPPSREVKFG